MEKPQPYFLHSRVPHATEWTALWVVAALLLWMMMMPWQDESMGLGRGRGRNGGRTIGLIGWILEEAGAGAGTGNGGRTILVGWKLCAVIISV